MVNKKVLLFLLFFYLVSLGFSQKSTEYHYYKSKYPDEDLVKINSENEIDKDIHNNQIIISNKSISDVIYLGQNAKYQSKRNIYTSDFFTLDNISASSFNFVNEKYKEFKVKNFKEKDEKTSSFYDDVKTVNFYFTGLEPGSKTHLAYQKSIHNPRFMGAYFLGDFYPIENYKLKITANKNIFLDFKMMYTDSIDITYVKTEKGNKNIYEWTLKNLKKYQDGNNIVNFKYRIPHIIPLIKYYVSDNDTVNVLRSTKDLYAWYQSLVKNINKEPCNRELKILVDSLVSTCDTDYEKVKNIYYWTQKNIKYVAFEDGLGGFIPRNANEVYKKKYGDCKDNSSLLKQMLAAANIEGHLTWIGTRSIPYKYDEVHSPIVDNHMILTYFDDEKPYFLDATGRFQKMDVPTSFIQGKEALVEVDSNLYKIIEVPIVDNQVNTISDSVEISLQDDLIKGQGSIKFNGYEKITIFNDLETLTTDEHYDNYLKNKLEIGNNHFLLDSIWEVNKFNYDEKFIVNYLFTLKNYHKSIGEKIYLNLNLNQKDIASIKVEPPFYANIDYTHVYTGAYYIKFNIPEHYEIDFIPSNFEINNEICNIKIEYSVTENNEIEYYHVIKTNLLTISIEQQEILLKSLEKVQKNYKELVVLKLKNHE